MSATTIQHLLVPEKNDHSSAPLLFVFLIPMLAIIAMVLWLFSGPTWFIVGATIVAILLMTGFVIGAIGRLTSDDALDD